jgi:hypothetical protein
MVNRGVVAVYPEIPDHYFDSLRLPDSASPPKLNPVKPPVARDPYAR